MVGDVVQRVVIVTLCVHAQRLHVLNRTMVIGRRWNVRWQRSSHLYRPEAVSEAARTNGHLHVACAVDYFLIAGNRFPWRDMRDAVIARRGYDNFLVTFAVRNNVSVVDATDSLLAVHQSDDESRDQRRHVKDTNYNMLHLPLRFRINSGLTSSSQFLTVRNSSEIVVVRRRAIPARSRFRKDLFSHIV